MLFHPFLRRLRTARRHQGADGRGRYAQVGDAVALDHLPDAPGVRVVRRAVVHEQGSAEHQRAAYGPRPHHPANIGVPEEDVARLHVEAVRQVLRALDREAAMRVLRPLGLARGARGVYDHIQLLGPGADALTGVRLVFD